MRVLIAEDEVGIRDMLRRGLSESGYVVDQAATGSDALHMLRLHPYAAAIIDWRMPEMSGVDVIREVRRRRIDLPVLLLTARDGLRDRVEGLDAGADDYLIKPFEFDELLARLRALLRRPNRGSMAVYDVDDLVVNVASRSVSVREAAVEVSPTEFAILELLANRAPMTVSLREIALQVWPNEADLIGSNTIHVHVGRLRRKIATARARIVTVRGQGFRLEVNG